ncbi:MAG: ribosome recycling factor [Capnocytophaga endodontalis]
MNEEINIILDTTNEAMQEALQHLDKALGNIRAGKASPQMVSSVMVDYYGAQTPLSQVANVSAPDSRTISIQPWEKKMIQPIEKAIQIANLGFNPMNNGEMVIITVPPLTEERRRELVKQAKGEGEDAKISVRNARQDANKEIKKVETSDDIKKDAEERVQKLTDKYIKKVEEVLAVKEAYILKVYVYVRDKR